MESVMPALEHGLLILACVLAIPVLLINGYMSIRKRFPITVNCWFCNTNTRVPYENANCFMCPSCQQYNGFNADGSYNKYIPEQYDEKRNSPASSVRRNLDKSNTNGFCKSCNINQDLKVKQLAAFVPINEKNFDSEVEEYRKKLEDVYKLCSKCENVLRVTLSVQNSWFFGQTVNYLRKMKNSSTTLLNLNISSHGMTKDRKRSIVTNMMQLLLILLAVFILYNNIFMKLLLTNAQEICVGAVQYIPKALIHHYNEVEMHLKTAINMTEAYIHNKFNSDSFFDTTAFDRHKSLHLSTVGLLVQSVLLLWADDSSARKKDFVSWMGLTLLSVLPHSEKFHPYVHVVQSQLAVYVILSVFLRKYTLPKQGIKVIKRKVPASTPLAQDCEYSDKEDDILEDISHLSKNSSNSSFASTKTAKSDNRWTKLERSKVISNVLHKLNGKNKINPKKKAHTSINKSLNNLHLSNDDMKHFKQFTKPVISPPRFTATAQVITNPQWGGNVEFSRSSSSTSGFCSQAAENENNTKQNSASHTRKNSLSEESEKSSCSELRNVFGSQNNVNTTKNNPPPYNFHSQSLNSDNKNETVLNKPEYSSDKNLSSSALYKNDTYYRKNLLSPSSFGNTFPSGNPLSPNHFNTAYRDGSQTSPIYRNENTFYPNLNQNSMLYIQVNKNQDSQDRPSFVNRDACYTSKLFNMEALAKLNQQNNCDLEKMNNLSNRFKL